MECLLLKTVKMSTTNCIYVPSYGTDESKFERIPAFETYTNAKLFKKVVSGFRMAGKVKDYVNAHCIATFYYGTCYNGYGYSHHVYCYLLRPRDAKVVIEMIGQKELIPKKPKPTFEEKKVAWAKRLSKLTGVPFERCLEIAEEKLDDKWERINNLESRQYSMRYSTRRQSLINKIERENPLRRIKDKEHAFNILAASVRHNESDYEQVLDEAKEMAAWGDIDKSEVKEYARQHTHYYGDIQSTFFPNENEEG